MSEREDLSTLEAKLGHHFKRPALLVQAVTHSSLRHELYTAPREAQRAKTGSPQGLAAEAGAQPDPGDNERLEFLGDAIVGLLVAESLYRRYPNLSEGELTRLRAALVSRQHLGEVGERLGLGRWLRMSKSEERSGGRKKAVLLANCVEALVAALYLDSGLETGKDTGELATAAAFVESAVIGMEAQKLHKELQANQAIGDYKSALQEFLQARGGSQPVYTVKAETGPDHRKRFQVEVLLAPTDTDPGRALAQGRGSTKKKAEQEAARKAFVRLQEAGQEAGMDKAESAGAQQKLQGALAGEAAKPAGTPAADAAAVHAGAGVATR